MISDIGSTNTDALICHTDRPASNGNTNPGGNWFAPNVDDSVPGFRINKAPMIIRLLSGSSTPAQGIYHCSIEVQRDQVMLQNVHVGLYHSGEGMQQSNCVFTIIFNPRRACTGGLRYLSCVLCMCACVRVCMCVYLSVCLSLC